MSRDFAGYANQYPNVRWPHGAQLAVAVVLNIEEGAELALSSGDERNEARADLACFPLPIESRSCYLSTRETSA